MLLVSFYFKTSVTIPDTLISNPTFGHLSGIDGSAWQSAVALVLSPPELSGDQDGQASSRNII